MDLCLQLSNTLKEFSLWRHTNEANRLDEKAKTISFGAEADVDEIKT